MISAAIRSLNVAEEQKQQVEAAKAAQTKTDSMNRSTKSSDTCVK